MFLIKSYFDNTQTILLISAGLLFIISLFFHVKNKENLSLIFLIFTGICVFSFAALLDPFLNVWDERFHALVGKNLMNHPLMPTLYDDPVVNMAYDRWDRYHIWLHKQPLFLWQIALSFKLFGISEFTLRLPSVVLGVILIFIGYRSGKLLVNSRVGYLTGILIISDIYFIELIAGRLTLDHNDFSFLVYISLSVWSFIEYYYSNKKIWIFMIGLFSGMAILCKWVVGLLVYFGWFILKLQQKKFRISEYKDVFISVIITLIIALPWQILSFIWYPAEAASAYKFNLLHFSKPLDGHSGNLWFHFNELNHIYGSWTLILVLPAFWILFKKIRNKELFIPLAGMVLIVYLFFSLANTKMPSFTTVVCLVVFIAFASLFDYLIDFIKNISIEKLHFKWFVFIVVITLIVVRFDINYLERQHSFSNNDNNYSRMLSQNKMIFNSMELPANSVLFNVKGRHYVEAMFYTGFPSYNFIPSLVQYTDLKEKGRNIVIFKPEDELPDYLKNDLSVIIIEKILNECE